MAENNEILESNNHSGTGGTSLTNARSNNPLIRSSFLRPSMLTTSVLGTSASGNSNTAAAGEDIKDNKEEDLAANPFSKEQNDEVTSPTEKAASEKTMAEGNGSADAVPEKDKDDDEEPDDRPDPLTMLRKNGLERSNLFAAAKNAMPRVENSGFVFGQNVHERVIGENLSGTDANSNAQGNATGGSELLFSSFITNATGAEGVTEKKETDAKMLTDVAREYEESRAQKRKYEAVETFTGEENEVNIIDINCKLFAFVDSNWQERGRGSLRLNDSKNADECSRVVFRTAGNLRLLLNTKVWAGMVAEKPSQRSVRLTAMDNNGKIKVFLVMARPAEVEKLYLALLSRIAKRQAAHPEEAQLANNCVADESKNGNANSSVEHLEDGLDADADGKSNDGLDANDELSAPSSKKSGAAGDV